MTQPQCLPSDFASLSHLASAVHSLAKEKGWYDQPETDDQFVARSVANLHGEVSELWEAHRNGCLTAHCDKAVKMTQAGLMALTCEEEELADLIIRVLDHAVRRNIDIGQAVLMKHAFNNTREYRHGGKKA